MSIGRIDKDPDLFKKLVMEAKSVPDLVAKLGYSTRGSCASHYRLFKRKCLQYNIDYFHLIRNQKPIEIDKESLQEIVSKSDSFAGILRSLGYKDNNGTANRNVKDVIREMGIDVSHLSGQKWASGRNRFTDKIMRARAEKAEIPWNEAFKKDSITKNEVLMKRLVASGKRKYECQQCGINKWNNKMLRLRLDHINGDNTDNQEANLRFLCPNCDSQTDTFCRGTRKPSKKNTWWESLDKCFTMPLFESRNGVIGSSGSWRHRAKPEKRKVVRPSKEELEQMISSMSWCAIGRKYSVSDAAIRKWANFYGIKWKKKFTRKVTTPAQVSQLAEEKS